MPRWLIIVLVMLLGSIADNTEPEGAAISPTDAVRQPPGVLAPDAPLQENFRTSVPLIHLRDVTLTPRAHLSVTARVLAREHYSNDIDSRAVPDDLGLGWGRMSDSAVLASFEFLLSGRVLRIHMKEKIYPIPFVETYTSLSNMHMIPANDAVRRELEKTRVGQVVHFDGFLVDAYSLNGWHRKTSMTWDQIGGNSCKQVYVKSFNIVAP